MDINVSLNEFLSRNQLDSEYLACASKWYTAAELAILSHQKGASKTVLIGINGCQGSGKSTLADYLATLLHNKYQLNVAVLSLDDFYFSHAYRLKLAESIHPLLATRGVPGTHDVPLALEVISQLKGSKKGNKVALPRFDKKTDNPKPKDQWPLIEGPVDVILFEGWCFGVEAQDKEALVFPENYLEFHQDPNLTWRRYVNEQLLTSFPDLYKGVDLWLMLKAPSFAVVKQWRLEQEQKLAATLVGDVSKTKVMNETQIKHFISFFERLTEHCLATLPAKCHFVYQLDEQRNIVDLSSPVSLPMTKEEQLEKLKVPAFKNSLIYTDLDGTLLDHDTYSFEATLPVLTKLQAHNVPVIPNTSKTAAELLVLRQQLKLDTPFIIENGAAIYLPKKLFPYCPAECIDLGDFWLKAFVPARAHWLSCIKSTLLSLPEGFNAEFTAMSQMSIQEIVAATGLSKDEAKLAAERGYGEPILWKGTEADKILFKNELKKQGANVLEGGRFLHVCGQCNKGDAMLWLNALYQQIKQQAVCSIALGDGNNDINMLETADIAVLIKSPSHSLPVLTSNNKVIVSDSFGPSGWAQSLTQLFQLNLID